MTPEQFRNLYMEPRKPVILKDLASSWPAAGKWTPDYFKEKYGQLEVKVHNASYSLPGKHYMSNFDRMPFAQYLDLMMTSPLDLRMFAFNIFWHAPELKQDIVFPGVARKFSKNIILMFFGCKNSATPMHYDLDMKHVLHTVLYGKKRVVLFPNEETINLYKHPFNTRSYVDVDHPDFKRFPRLKNARGYQEIIYPGETLFIPSGYWHYVVYEEGGYGVSIRCTDSNLVRRMRGLADILVCLPIDKLLNRLLGHQWFRYKERKAALEGAVMQRKRSVFVKLLQTRHLSTLLGFRGRSH